MKNKSFKWLRSLFLAIVLTTVTIMGLPLTGGPITALAADKDIVVLYTNDVHCGVDDNIGYAGLALYKKEMQQQTPYDMILLFLETMNLTMACPDFWSWPGN